MDFKLGKIGFMLLVAFCAVTCSASQGKKPKEYTAKIAESLPHYIKAYTQGLFFFQGRLYESSGQYKQSFFHEVDLKKGTSLRSLNLPPKYFAEGAVVFGKRIYILTWMENSVLVYDLDTFKPLTTLYNPREGWGLTTDGEQLISTDGSSNLYFHDPATFRELSRVEVTLNGNPLDQLNELEYIKGDIWANVYGSDVIVIIDPSTGVVKATVDCSGLLPYYQRKPDTDVLNGIAYDAEKDFVYVTGKYWPRMYRIELIKK